MNDNRITQAELDTYLKDKVSVQARRMGREQDPELQSSDPARTIVSWVRRYIIFTVMALAVFAYGQNVAPRLVPSNVKVSQASGRVVVEIDTFLVFARECEPPEAENEMRKFVRELALREAIPADVSISSLVSDMYIETKDSYDEKMGVQCIPHVLPVRGRFEKEEFLEREPSFEGSSLHFRQHYRAHIVPQERVYNPSMNLSVELSNNLLRHGMILNSASRRMWMAYLYLFDFLNDSSVAMVVSQCVYY